MAGEAEPIRVSIQLRQYDRIRGTPPAGKLPARSYTRPGERLGVVLGNVVKNRLDVGSSRSCETDDHPASLRKKACISLSGMKDSGFAHTRRYSRRCSVI